MTLKTLQKEVTDEIDRLRRVCEPHGGRSLLLLDGERRFIRGTIENRWTSILHDPQPPFLAADRREGRKLSRRKPMPHEPEGENKRIHDREARENAPHLARAWLIGKPVTYTASDGCEVTVTPDGHTFFNSADWY